jgi:asparagine synthase (glutamine-hydrolysing)
MAEKIYSRGPDDCGVYVDQNTDLALAHRRLSIQDLSHAGHQPMQSPSGRYQVVFNGEIYNHLELRERLPGQFWRGYSDTETLLATIDAFGIHGTLDRLTGMFALALWDKTKQELILARDRLGEKPLYYGWFGSDFVFASELKALTCLKGWQGEIDREALASFMRYGYIPTPHSIYLGIRKLIPGTYIRIRDVNRNEHWPAPTEFWSAKTIAEFATKQPLSDQEATDTLEKLLAASVSRQMISDVPVGAFLSGGVDSSTIVALMQSHTSRPVKTFTIGFEESDYDETQHAKAVAKHLGTDHTHRTLCNAGRGFGSNSELAENLRRAFRRPIGCADLSGITFSPHGCYGISLGRWRRRVVWWIQPIFLGPSAMEVDRSIACSREARHCSRLAVRFTERLGPPWPLVATKAEAIDPRRSNS